MAYVDTPLAAEDLDVSQPLIRGNFQQANTSFGIDHYSFSDLTANNGKHKFVHLPEQSPNGPSTAANEGAIYTKEAGTITRLFWRPENTAAAGVEYQLTNINPFTSAPNGYTFLPNGLLLIFGTATVVLGNTSFTVTFPNALTLTANPYSVNYVSNGLASTPRVTSISTTGFSGSCSSTTTAIYWMAIGPK